MSFSAQVKTELCKTPMQRGCCAKAEVYGTLLYASAFSHEEIRLSTEHIDIVKRLQMLLQRVFFITTEPRTVGRKKQICITDKTEIERIFEAFGYDYKNQIKYHFNRNVLETECCEIAFLRGVFLMAGTVAGPDKKSHLEIKSNHQSLGGEVMSLMLDMGQSPKISQRKNGHILYFKDGERVEDFLMTIGARRAAMELMEAKVEKNLRNTVNRQVNCETANIVKTTNAAAKQVEAIEFLLKNHGESGIPEQLLETANLRLQYPTDSLAELAARFEPPISKPGVSHRLKKLIELSKTEGK